jgi:AraC family transcriptional activator of mtrCDE
MLASGNRSELTGWRMHFADEMPRFQGSSVATIAEQLGYQTEAAFRRAFRRVRGFGPGSVRRRARAGGPHGA